MARLHEGPCTFFRLSPADLEKPECFSIQWGAIKQTRCDVDFHHPEFRELRARIEGLSKTATVEKIIRLPLTSGFAAGKDDRVKSSDVAIQQIRPTQILPIGELDFSEAYGIRKTDTVELDYIEDGEVLFNNTNSTVWVGKSSVFRGTKLVVCSNHVTRLRLIKGIQPEFIADVLNLLRERRYFARLCTNFNNQAGVNTDALAAVRLPLPEKAERTKLLAAMDAARAEHRAKLTEADALLAGLDSFLLTSLGLTPPPKDDRKVFAVRRIEAQQQSRLNADYFHPERVLALRTMEQAAKRLACQPLAEVVSFIRNQIKTRAANYLSLAHVQSHTGELIAANEDVAGACSTFKLDDVLFARLRPYLNKVYRAENAGCCSPEFHVLRANDPAALRPDFLAAILRSSLILAQTRHMMTGNTHPRLTNEDVVNLIIPIPKPAVQETIAAEARRRREEARRLRVEAEAGWQAAKRWFEEQLIGPARR